ncbi:hypothetical protein OSB04_007909 [Centaurea solstitialis]|uniref:Uncharacterized protein n=1 Tax=Centaurea solstitialis TaxID=347529 RepID=A0AA38TMG8_9ASTR|nr:hypothetical protein OSB04_007909 [Centaurea solstitialis]
MQRHRNPANGYRSNPIGIGGGGGGGIAAGGPGYRSYNRGGFGRGQQPKVFQSGNSQPPPPRRVDVFMEAGKLATEYLVSKGLLPPNPVNGKWQNSNLKSQVGVGGGDGVPDADSGTGGGRRRFPDDYGSATGSRDGVRARRTMGGSFKNPGFEWNREISRSSSLSEKAKPSLDNKQGDGDSVSGSVEEQRSGKDGAVEDQKSVSGDLESRNSEAGNVETAIDEKPNQLPDDNAGIKTPISDVESAEKSDSLKIPSTSEVIMDDDKREPDKPIVKEEPAQEHSTDENKNTSANNASSDLLTLIRFNKVPTRTRSSVTLKGSKSDSLLTSGDENKNKIQNSAEPTNSLQDVPMADENQESNHELKIEEVPIEEEVAQIDHKYNFGSRSQSFPQRSSVTDEELGEEQHGYNRSSSVVLGRGEKRPLHLSDSPESAKKPRDWTSGDGYLHLSNSREDQPSGITQPCNVYAEEKQLFPNSFKICDLNLMEVSDVNDNHDTNSVIGFSSIRQPKQEPGSVDFDLTMNSSCDITDRQTRRGADDKEVEVIDLDCDSGQDDKGFNNSERREEAIFTDLESFPDSMQRVSDLPQDGYGLMISELLEADIPNSTVPTGVNSMHNEMSLQNEEVSRYFFPESCFVPVWDQQPSQGYDKRY